MKVKV